MERTGMLTALIAAAALGSTAAAAPEAPQAQPVQPILPVPGAFVDAGKTLLRPFQPRPEDLWVWIPTVVTTAAAMVWDVPLYHQIHDNWPDPMIGDQRLSYWGSYLGEWYPDVAALVTIGLFGSEHGQRACRAGLEALAAVAVLSRAMKLTFRLERPSYDGDAKHWFSRLTADAFPSGHAMTAFATAAVLADAYPRLAPLFYVLATYVGIARVQQSTHWVSDVTVGTAFGLLFGWAAYHLNESVEVAPAAVKDARGLVLRGRF
jgi:membrane-associated phospholipid phosphatase